MKRLAVLFLLCCSLVLTGCDDKDAQQYAKQLIEVLDSYQTQTERKISAERDSYKELASVYERASRRNIELSLEEERVERSEKLVSEMITADHLPHNTEILDSLRAYAEQDFNSTRDFLQVEADAQAQFLGDIEALEFESETIDDLSASLKLLAKPKGRLKRISDAAVFAQDSKKEFDKLVCQDLDAALEAQNTRLKELTSERDDLLKELAELNKAPAGSRDHQRIDFVGEEIGTKNAEMDDTRRRISAIGEEKKEKCS